MGRRYQTSVDLLRVEAAPAEIQVIFSIRIVSITDDDVAAEAVRRTAGRSSRAAG